MRRRSVDYAMDAGSIPNENFAWVSTNQQAGCCDLEALGAAIVKDLEGGVGVTLGFECPLFWPCPVDTSDLGKQRPGESGRSWSAGAGATVTPTGCQTLAWLFRYIKERQPHVGASTQWGDYAIGFVEFFVWEAFASKKPDGITHEMDAALILETYRHWSDGSAIVQHVIASHPISLAAALLLWSGLSTDLRLLHLPCVALRVKYP